MKYSVFTLICAMVLVGCGRGPVGAAGPKGDSGSQGIQGEQGIPGRDGEDGEDAQVSIVKLCPGVTTYPTRFVEVAFCFDGKLYGTYSANGGFSTELPPGNYSSNAIGSSCNFRVLPDCIIQN